MRRAFTRARREDGIVMVIVMGCLLVLGILSAGVVLTATASDQGTRARSASDRALSAAQAGLQAAIYRLNASSSTGDNQCIPVDNLGVAWTPSATLCDSNLYAGQLYSGRTGNASWRFWMTPVIGTIEPNGMRVPDTCTGTPLPAPVTGARLPMRCVTAQGNALSPDGRVLGTRRIQARIAAYASLFPIPGIFGNQCLAIGGTQASCDGGNGGGTTNVTGSIGSNGQINAAITNWWALNNPSARGDTYLGKGAPAPAYQKSIPANTYYVPEQIQLPDMDTVFTDPGKPTRSSYVTRNPGGLDVAAYNDNATGIHLDNNCKTNNGSGYIAPRTLILTSKGGNNVCTVTLDDGIYDFCSIQMTDGKSQIVVADTNANSAEVRIFVDSWRRSGSGCVSTGDDSKDGNISNPQGNSFLANATTALAGQLYVYGNPANPDSHVFAMTNGNDYTGLLFASNSFVTIKNSGAFKGGLAGYKLSLQNGTSFVWDPTVNWADATTDKTYYRTHWSECTRNPTVASDPTSGC